MLCFSGNFNTIVTIPNVLCLQESRHIFWATWWTIRSSLPLWLQGCWIFTIFKYWSTERWQLTPWVPQVLLILPSSSAVLSDSHSLFAQLASSTNLSWLCVITLCSWAYHHQQQQSKCILEIKIFCIQISKIILIFCVLSPLRSV